MRGLRLGRERRLPRHEECNHSAGQNRHGKLERQIDPAGDREYRRPPTRAAALEIHVERDHDAANERARRDHVPRQAAAQHALRDRRHEIRLRCEQCVRVLRCARPDAISVQQQVQDRRHEQHGRDHPERLAELLPPRRRAEQVAGLQHLQVVAPDRCSTADDGAHEDGRGRSRRRIAPHEAEQQ